ncbi:Extracellular matrix protein 3, partial [Geodia barretti]
ASLTYSTVDGAAAAPADFTTTSGTLTVTDDNPVQCVSIAIIDDIDDEEDSECFAFTVSVVTALEGVSLGTSQATICITDNDATDVTMGLSQTIYSVQEEDSFALVCTAVISGSTAGRSIDINYQTTDGDAQASSDYIAASGNFDMTDTNTVQCIPISIISDSVTETDEECFTFTISTTSTSPGLIVSPTTATICIREPEEVGLEPVTIGLKQSFYSTLEGEGLVEICVSAVFGDFSGSNFTINYTTADAQAEAPSDYVAVSGSVEISESQTSQCVSVSTVIDSVEEGEECFLVSFSSSSSDFTLQSPSVATVCIRDAPTVTPVSIGLQMTEYSVIEPEDYQFVCAEVQSGDVAGRDIEIDFVVEDSDGAMTQNGTLLFTDDATIQCVAVSVSSVSAGSTDESCLTLTLSPTTTVTGLTISPDVATVCVTSADDGDTSVIVGIEQGFYSAKENDGPKQICVEAVSGDINGRNILVDFMTIDGSAKAPGDFASTRGTLQLTEYNSVQCVNISIENDNEDEQEQECFVFTITSMALEDVVLSTASATICIFDDDATQVTVGLQDISYEVVEDDRFVIVCTAVLSGDTAGRTIITAYQTSNGNAIASDDYTAVSGNFDMTDTNTVQCIPISIISDSVTETDEECFTFTISTTSTAPGLTLSPTSATICISDQQEGVTVGLQQSYYMTVEGEGPVEICLGLLSGDITGSTFIIDYNTINGLAEAPLDYVMQSGSLTISEAQTSDCLSISIVADVVEEPDMECFVVRFSSTASGLNLSPSIATVCINEGPRAVLSLMPPVVLEGQTAQACLSLTRLDRLSETANITLSTTGVGSTATGGSDYIAASQEFQIGSGIAETQVCLPVMTLEDELVEDPETLSVVVTGLTAGVSFTGSPATLLIHSNEAVYYQLVETVYAVQENISSFQVTVELAPSSGDLLEDVTLYVSSVGGSAMELLDYRALDSIPLVFAAGSTSGDSLRFSVEIVDDSLVEGSEQFLVTVTDSTASAIPVAGQDTLSVAIIDNDFEINAGFAVLEYTAEEGVGLLAVCLEVFGLDTLSQASLVRITTVPGTAEGKSCASMNSIMSVL